MTEWVEEPTGGRPRGPAGLVRAWMGIMRQPRAFFRNQLSTGDQAPGLLFAATIVLIEEATRLALVPEAIPVYRGQIVASVALWLLAAVVLVTPAVVHLATAVVTLVLMATAPNRGGVSETVQIICYSLAPCVVAGLAIPLLTAVAAIWGTCLLIIGTLEVHGTGFPRALPAIAVPGAVIFGVGFRGLESLSAVGLAGADVLRTLFG